MINSFKKKMSPDLGKRSFFSSQQFMAAVALILVYLIFFVLSPHFRTVNTMTSILDSAYYIGFLAIGVTFIIATGGIDLSLGTVMMASGLIGAMLYNKFEMPLWVAIITTMLIALGFGTLNGFLVAYLRLPAFIATLGTSMIAQGMGQIVTKVTTYTWPGTRHADGWYRKLFRLRTVTEDGGVNIPTGLILFILMAIVMAIVLNKTRTGRYILSIGSNSEATRLSGINTKWSTMRAYMICGFFVGLAAIAFAATYTTFMPGQGGGEELNAIAGVVIGGTSLSGGTASILGTMIGVMLMAVLKTGLPYINLQAHWQVFITGFVILGAVLLDVARSKKGR